MRTCAGVYLVPHWLFTGNILDTHIRPRNSNNTFWPVFSSGALGYDKWYLSDLAHSPCGLRYTIT